MDQSWTDFPETQPQNLSTSFSVTTYSIRPYTPSNSCKRYGLRLLVLIISCNLESKQLLIPQGLTAEAASGHTAIATTQRIFIA